MTTPVKPEHRFDEEPQPTMGERNWASGTHVASIFFPLWVPFFIFLIHRQRSRFISAHALQAVYEGLWWKAILLAAMIASLAWTIARGVYHIQTGFENLSWQEVLIKGLISVGVLVTLFLVNTIQSVVQTFQARAGKWPKQRRWLRKLSAVKR